MGALLEILGEAIGGVLGHPVVGLLATAVGLGALVLWIASAWWTWRDMAARATDPISPYIAAAGVLVATPALFPLALAIYRIVRPPERSAEVEVAALRAAALVPSMEAEPCPACGTRTLAGWRRCPACAAELAVMCESCQRPIGVGWAICPWCAAEPPSPGVTA